MATVESCRLVTLETPSDYFSAHSDQMIRLGSQAFGRDPVDFAEDVENHFSEAEHGHILEDSGEPVGFALYRNLGKNMLWLQGIAIDRSCQGSGMGTFAVREAFNGSELLVATTRNPATVKLVGNATNISCPDIRLGEPLTHMSDERIQQGFKDFGQYVGADPKLAPYLVDRYPDGLYGEDPGVRMPMPEIAQYPKNALMVVGIK